MQTIKTLDELTFFLKDVISKGSLGLVPTMGALHLGHLSLVKRSIRENTNTMVTIFVNPTQFDSESDLTHYPKTLDRDVELLNQEGCTAVFIPSLSTIYPNGPCCKRYHFGVLTQYMEGAFRNQYFDGVATFIQRIFALVRPDRTYFGEKDFQQLQVIRELVRQYEIDTKIVGCPTFREDTGLAMSSRNERLSEDAKVLSGLIYKTLCRARQLFLDRVSNEHIKSFVKKVFETSPFELEYFEIAIEEKLIPIGNEDFDASLRIRGFIAVFLEGVRLIDNLPFYSSSSTILPSTSDH